MARMKIGTKGSRTRVVQVLRVMGTQLRNAERKANRGDCAGAQRILSRAYDNAEYPAAQRTRDLAHSKVSRVSRRIARVCK